MSQEILTKPDAVPKPYPEADSSSEQASKVAEGLATYAYTPLKKPMAPQHFIAGIVASEEVWRFAVTNELNTHLETAVQMVPQTFQKVAAMRFTYDIDPEIENESYITIHARVQGALDDLVKEHWTYTKAIVRAIPINKLPLISFSPEVI